MAKKEPKSLFRRLTRLFRSGPVVKRKIRALDTTLALADKTKSSGTLLFQKSLSPTYATITSNAYNLSERLMRYQDFQEMEYSVSFQTLIPTTEGLKPIGSLAAECAVDPNKTFIVYSYDHEKKRIVPALGKQARQTCVDHAWKVTFDNGKEITASPEHRLMLRDGTYRKVEDLQPGDAMMPFHRRDLFAGAEEGTKGYSWVYTMDDRFRGWTKEHQLIAEWVAGRELAPDEVVHHINFNKTDNRPENLMIMTASDHNSYHASLNNGVKWAPENHEWIEEFKKNHATWMRDNAPTRRHDVTFSRILEACERVGFKLSAVKGALDVSDQLISERLVAQGFDSFSSFSEAYRSGVVDAIVNDRPGLLTRDLTLETIKAKIDSSDTKRSLAVKLGCTVNVLDKFLARRERMTWTDLRQTMGYHVKAVDPVRSGGRPKGANGNSLTFKQICDAYVADLTLPRLAEKLGVNKNTIISRLAQQGHRKYSDFASIYQNCKVVSVEYVGEMPLYDLTVDGYKNFATDSVVSHNTPEIAAALDIYADETCAQDDKGRVLHVYSDNEKVKEVLEDLFYNTLNVEFNLRSWARNLVKYGDFFLYNDVSPEYGVVNAFPIPVNEIEREENYDRDDPFAVRYRWVTLGNRTLENWEVTHFRLLGNDMFLPYGSSVIEPARRIWRQLILIEDAMLVYRVVRAPERRVFYIDVANVPPENVPMYIEEQRRNLRTNQVIDGQTGRVDLRYNPLSVDEDYFIPVRGGDSGTKIDTLAGGQNAAAVEDVAYIQKKLFAALKIPRAYLGYDELLSCLTADVQVPLLSGVTVAIHDLAQLDWTKKQDVWVYSTDPLTGRVVPGRVMKAWKTRDASELYDVSIDDGGTLRVTGNHPFLCRDGIYRRADELQPGQSLMPLYRKLSSRADGDFQDGYEKVLDNSSGKWKYTHRVVADAGVVGDDPSRISERSYVIHHVDHDKRNNAPQNLVKMGKRAHAMHHASGAEANLLLTSSRDRLREVMQTETYRSTHRKGVQRAWDGDHGARRQSVADNNTRHKRRDVDLTAARTVAMTCEDRSQFYRTIGLTYTGFMNACRRQGVHHGEWLTSVFGNKRLGIPRNHRVTSVTSVVLDVPVPVYDLEVEGWHNFAVSDNGTGFIYVHNSKATLAQEDIRFSRTVNVIQKTMLAELNKLAIIHLYTHGYDGEDLQNFTLRLSNPSTVAQQQKLELWRAKFEIGGSLPEGMGSKHFVQHEIWGLSDEEIEEIDQQRMKEKLRDASIEAASPDGEGAAGGGPPPGGGGADDLFGGGGGDEASGGDEPDEPPPEENAGEEAEEEVTPDVALLTSADDPDDDEDFALKLSLNDGDSPIKPNDQVSRKKHYDYNRSRIQNHGPAKTHMPDFVKMTGIDNESMKDPTGSEWMRSTVSNPFGEARSRAGRSPFDGLPPDIWSALRKLSTAMKVNVTSPGGVMTEGIDVQDEIDGIDEEASGVPPHTRDNDEVLIIDDPGDELEAWDDE